MSQNQHDPHYIVNRLSRLYRKNGYDVRVNKAEQGGDFVLILSSGETERQVKIKFYEKRNADHMLAYSRAVESGAVGSWYCVTDDGPHLQTVHIVPDSLQASRPIPDAIETILRRNPKK